MESASGFDSNSPNPADPLFTALPGDLTLRAGSPANGAGTPISWITTDYLGNERDGSTPDIGAYESDIPVDTDQITFTEPANSLEVYPNPASDNLWLEYIILGDSIVTEVFIYDIDGRLVHTQKVRNAFGVEQIDVSKLSAGSYVLKFGKYTKQFNIAK